MASGNLRRIIKLEARFIYVGYLNFILLTPLISIVFGIVGFGIPANVVTMVLNFLLLFITNKYHRIFSYNLIFFIVIVSITFIIYWSSLISGYLASPEKFYLIVYNVLIPVIILLLIGNVKNDLIFESLWKKNWLNIYAKAIGFLLIILFFAFNFPYDDGRPILPGMENPIWLARIFGTLLVLAFLDKFGLRYGLVDITYKALLGWIILSIGSRGVIFSVTVVLLVLYWKIVRLSKTRMRLFILFSLIFILVGVYYLFNYELNPESLYSSYRRLELLEEFRSVEFISVFGNGLGTFGPLVIGLDERDYPHNYFFEYLFEFGIVGIFCSIAMIMILIRKSKNSLIGYMGFYFFLGSLSSGDIPGNANYYLSLFVLLFIRSVR